MHFTFYNSCFVLYSAKMKIKMFFLRDFDYFLIVNNNVSLCQYFESGKH